MDKRRSYAVARREIIPNIERRSHWGLNNRAKDLLQPTRRREQGMRKFKSSGQLQRFLYIHDPILNFFHLPRRKMTSIAFGEMRSLVMQVWRDIVQVEAA